MFKKDVKSIESRALKALDILQLSLDLEDLIIFEAESTHAQKILGHLAKSPHLLFKFLEWLEVQTIGISPSQFSLTNELIQYLPKSRLFNFQNSHLTLLLNQCDRRKLMQLFRSRLLDDLPNWLELQNRPLQEIHRHERTFLNEASKSFEADFWNLLSKQAKDLPAHKKITRADLLRLRPFFSEAIEKSLEWITSKVKRHVDQKLGHKGVLNFIHEVQQKFSLSSIFKLEKGLLGNQLYQLNYHLKVSSEIAHHFTSLYQNQHSKPQGIYPNQLLPFNYLQELGLALTMTHFPEVEKEIWSEIQLLQQQNTCKRELTLSDFSNVESTCFRNRQLWQLEKQLHRCDVTQLQKILQESDFTLFKLNHQEQLKHLAQTYLEHFDTEQSLAEQPLWIQALCELLDPKEPDNWVPLKHRGQIARDYLNSIQSSKELVKGCYHRYNNFLQNHHNESSLSLHTIESLIVSWSKHLTNELSKRYHYALPCWHLGFNQNQVHELMQALSHKLKLNLDDLELLSAKCLDYFEIQYSNKALPIKHEINPVEIITHSKYLKELYFHQISNFFRDSKHFRGGLTRFHLWSHHIMNVFNTSLLDYGHDFFSELEIELRRFCRVMDVKIKPKLAHHQEDIHAYFSLLFEEFEFGDELYCLQFKHLIADVYVLDSKGEKLFDKECIEFLQLIFDYLLIHYSQDIWQLLKTKSELARRDIANQIQAHLPIDQLDTALISVKARMLDELFPSFDPLTEPEVIQHLNFGISSAHIPFKLIHTKDFDYWSTISSDPQKDPSHATPQTNLLPQLIEVIKSIDDKKPAPQFYSINANSKQVVHLSRIIDFKSHEGTSLWVMFQNISLEQAESTVQNFLDRGNSIELSRLKIQQAKPLGLHLLQTFTSDSSSKGLCQLTHLRPSLLKQFELLITSYQKELECILPNCPTIMKDAFLNFQKSCLSLWNEHQSELTSNLKLNQTTLLEFKHLRAQAESLKSSFRLKTIDLLTVLEDIRTQQHDFNISTPLLHLQCGAERLYLNLSDIHKFKQRYLHHSTDKLLKFSRCLEQLEQAWFIHERNSFIEGIKHYLDELAHEAHHQKNPHKPKLSFTIFLHQTSLPEPYRSDFPAIALECFSEGPAREGAHQRVVKSSGAGYDQIFQKHFNQFAAIAHRNVLTPESSPAYMECFYRLPTDEASLHPVETSMLKHRFFNTSGLSTLFLFPCKTANSEKSLIHKF